MPMHAAHDATRQRLLVRLMMLSIVTALVTLGLKTLAWALTGSVGLLSDAAESLVNLAAAVFGLLAVQWAEQPADEEHAYGHEKANYLSAGAEGALILLAAGTIAFSAVTRLADPSGLDAVGVALGVSAVASVLNLVMARRLIAEGKARGSLVLEADGRHLMTDVWTSVGVIVGVGAASLTGWDRLDALVALVVVANIVYAGVQLVHRSMDGLMDRALDAHELERIDEILAGFVGEAVQFHALRTRRSGRRAFVSLHVLVPGRWSVQEGHDLAERVEQALRFAFDHATVFTHLEPIEDPASFEDTELDRDVERPVRP